MRTPQGEELRRLSSRAPPRRVLGCSRPHSTRPRSRRPDSRHDSCSRVAAFASRADRPATSVSVLRAGQGTSTVVFVHGLGGSRRAFKREFARLSSTHCVVAYDLVGHGEDRGRTAGLDLEDLIAQLLQIVDQADCPVNICALSYGSYVANTFASRFPEKVASVCVIGGHYNNPSRLFDVFEEQWRRRDAPYAQWLLGYARAINPEEAEGAGVARLSREIFLRSTRTLHPTVVIDALRHRLEMDMKATLRTLRLPMLWVMGEYDELYRSCTWDLREVVPTARYVEFEKTGHAANLLEPRRFIAEYVRFLHSVNP